MTPRDPFIPLVTGALVGLCCIVAAGFIAWMIGSIA